MRHSLRITALLLAAGVVVLAAGCGGSNSSAPPTTAATDTQQVTTNGGTGSFASAKNCREFAGLAAKISSVTAATSGSDPQALGREFQALAAAAPADVKGDFETLATAFSGYLTAIENSGYKVGSTAVPTAAQIAALVKAAKTFNTAHVRNAEQHLSAWAQQNCK